LLATVAVSAAWPEKADRDGTPSVDRSYASDRAALGSDESGRQMMPNRRPCSRLGFSQPGVQSLPKHVEVADVELDARHDAVRDREVLAACNVSRKRKTPSACRHSRSPRAHSCEVLVRIREHERAW
jgi:hypothetical protein